MSGYTRKVRDSGVGGDVWILIDEEGCCAGDRLRRETGGVATELSPGVEERAPLENCGRARAGGGEEFDGLGSADADWRPVRLRCPSAERLSFCWLGAKAPSRRTTAGVPVRTLGPEG